MDVAREYARLLPNEGAAEAEREALLIEKRAMRAMWRWMACHPDAEHEERKRELAREMRSLGPKPAPTRLDAEPQAIAKTVTSLFPGPEFERWQRVLDGSDLAAIARNIRDHRLSVPRPRTLAQISAECGESLDDA